METVSWVPITELYVNVAFIFTVLCTMKQPSDVSASLEICITSEMFRVYTYTPKGTAKGSA